MYAGAVGLWRAMLARLTARFAAGSTPRPIDRVIGDMLRGSGRVGRLEALSVPAVQRGRNLICSIATLPLVQHGPDWQEVRLSLLEQIDPDVPNVVTLSQTIEDLLCDGVSWWWVTARGFDGFPTFCRHVDVSSVSLNPPGGMQRPAPLPGGYDPRNAVIYVDGRPVSVRDVIRFDSPNPPLLVAGARAIRRALLLDRAAEVYADGGRPLDYFSPADGAEDIGDDEIETMLSQWQARRKRRGTGWLPKALKYNAVDSPSPADLQLVALQQRAALDIANAMGLDPEELGISTTSRTYANVTDRRQDKINDTLAPYMSAITDRLSMGDVTRRGYRIAFDLDDYMRADPATRWATYQIAESMGATTVDEIRTDERRPALTAAQRRQTAPKAPAAPVPLPANVRPIRPTSAAFAGAEHTFVSLPVTGFKVDAAKRTIEGVALPYGAIGDNGAGRFRFAPGALELPGVMSRNKLLNNHDYAKSLGKMIHSEESDGGALVRYKVVRGPAGDQALIDAEDGAADGFSVGVDIIDAVPDPDNEGVMLVNHAIWHETSLTAMPAFDDARVTSVTASRTGGSPPMEPCTTCGQQHAPGVACTAPAITPAAPDMNAMFAAFMANYQPPVTPPEGPTFVNPLARPTGPAHVTDPAPYRFDRSGHLQPGSHSFSRDIVAHVGGDNTAHERLMDFVRQQFVTVADVAAVNPTEYRPELYVDQREFLYPVWDAINKGTMTEVTPFTFPKFNTATGLVANHVEGTEPALGTFTATTQTITPTPVSGKIKLPREAVDQVGNPQTDNLIWRQMTRAWYEALEAAAVAILATNAAAITDIPITTAAADSALDQALTAALAGLQFVRGGFTMDTMFTQIDLYKALVAAKDTAGRRLYPAISPQNAIGTVRSKFAALDLNGVTALPAWATAASGIVVASSWLLDRESVHGWASAPQRIDIDRTEVANVYIGLWGYKATAVSDVNGVREITYDPVAP